MSPRLKGQGIALIIGVFAGFLADLCGLPLPWMLGPMIATTIASVAGAPLVPPMQLRTIVFPVLGVMLGANVTPDIVDQLGAWAVTLGLMVPFLSVAAGSAYLIFRKLGRYDNVTAYFAAMPGGLTDMILMGEENGGDGRKIALAHAIRILVAISLIALFYGLVLGVRRNGGGNWVSFEALSLADWVILGACAVIGVPLGKFLRLPAAILLGPMILSAVAHFAHWVEVAPPSLLVIIAQIVMGVTIGCRFVGVEVKQLTRDLGLSVLACGAILIVAVVFSALTSSLTDTPIAAVFLAYSPGGVTEMSLLALTMGLEVAFVSVMHIARILLIIAIAPLAFRLFASGRS